MSSSRRKISFADYLRNPVVLWQHDANVPIARTIDMRLTPRGLAAAVVFPDAGVSAKSDKILGLIRSKIVNATSIGFRPIESQPLDARDPYARRYTKVELLEFSFVSVPANASVLRDNLDDCRSLLTLIVAQHKRVNYGAHRQSRQVSVPRRRAETIARDPRAHRSRGTSRTADDRGRSRPPSGAAPMSMRFDIDGVERPEGEQKLFYVENRRLRFAYVVRARSAAEVRRAIAESLMRFRAWKRAHTH